MTDHEVQLLRESQADKTKHVAVRVTGAAFSCCGRGWTRRDGYEQTFVGWVDNLTDPDGDKQGTFMVYNPGLGTISYVVAIRFFEVLDVEPVSAIA